ncbi:hypothetical protein EMIT0196MI5_120154 [Pseudomonas sp. IT-196MI5]
MLPVAFFSDEYEAVMRLRDDPSPALLSRLNQNINAADANGTSTSRSGRCYRPPPGITV